MKRLAIMIVVSFLLAACASGFGVRTTLTNDVESGCLQSRAIYDGHMDACIIRPALAVCSQSNVSTAVAVQAKAKSFCATNPPSTAANLATIKALVDQQRAAARAK